MEDPRRALIIANDTYEQAALRDLRAPAADAEALRRVLSDPQIGDFAVQVARNEPSHLIQAQIEDVFSEGRTDELLLLHFSGHGLKSESGELFFAARNTRPDRLRATAVPADFVQRCMQDSRSRRIVLLLDCCYGGAFTQGVRVRAGGDAHVLDSFPRGWPGGRGRAVITASSAMEYAFEGDHLGVDQQGQPSVFTSALVQGLATGDADQNGDGWISLSELYDYVFDRVRERNPHQTPTRLGAVAELRRQLEDRDLPTATGAFQTLGTVARTADSFIADSAAEALRTSSLQPARAELHFGQIEQDSDPPHQIIPLLGPPIARECAPFPSHDWICAAKAGDTLDISARTDGIGFLRGNLTLKGPVGEAVISVDIELVPPQLPPQPGTSQPRQLVDDAIPPAEAGPQLSHPVMPFAFPFPLGDKTSHETASPLPQPKAGRHSSLAPSPHTEQAEVFWTLVIAVIVTVVVVILGLANSAG